MAMTRYETRSGNEFVIPEYEGEVPEGMVFRCWTTEKDGSGLVYHPGDVRRAYGHVTLYPQFRRAKF